MGVSLDSEMLEIFERLDKLVFQGDHSSYLATETFEDELMIEGDLGGLALLARQVLYVAKSKVNGHHMHFDEASNLDKCDGKFIIGLAPSDGAK